MIKSAIIAETPTTAVAELAAIEARIDALAASAAPPAEVAAQLLGLGEAILEIWVESRGDTPTLTTKEGFRILALHRQGAKGDPSFNACRETVRELVYRHNVVAAAVQRGETAGIGSELTAAVMVARHLCFFISGKLLEAGLGEFCCSSKAKRSADLPSQPADQSLSR